MILGEAAVGVSPVSAADPEAGAVTRSRQQYTRQPQRKSDPSCPAEIMRSLCLLLCLASCLGQEAASPCSSQDTSCILTVLAMRGLIREEQAARQARNEWEGMRERGRGGARYRPDCWEQEDWPTSRGKRGTYALPEEQDGVTDETEEDSTPDMEGNYRTTEGRNSYKGSFQRNTSGEEGEGGRRQGKTRGRGMAPCLWEASYYTGDTQQTI